MGLWDHESGRSFHGKRRRIIKKRIGRRWKKVGREGEALPTSNRGYSGAGCLSRCFSAEACQVRRAEREDRRGQVVGASQSEWPECALPVGRPGYSLPRFKELIVRHHKKSVRAGMWRRELNVCSYSDGRIRNWMQNLAKNPRSVRGFSPVGLACVSALSI